MVSLLWSTFSLVLGFGVYFLVPFSVMGASVKWRQKVGRPYLKMASRCFKQWTFLRRVLSGYDVIPISVDDEQKLLKAKLGGGTLGDDNEYLFNDPDGRIKRLFNKPVALAYERVPAAIDAELAEIGYWVRQHEINSGIIVDDGSDGSTPVVDPYVPMADSLRLVDPIDVFEIVTNDISPENIKTVEALTRERYAEYGPKIGLTETLATLMGFGTAGVAMAIAAYVKQRILRGSGGGGGGISNPVESFPMLMDGMALVGDVMAVML